MNKKFNNIKTKCLYIEPQSGDILLNWSKNKKSHKRNITNSKEILNLNMDISKLSRSQLIGLYLLCEISLEKLKKLTNITEVEINNIMLLSCK
ncbi:hypothetical protein FDA33_10215 [Clostridium botulinum]|uniref:Uncharacterized protein n=1 Tax=Clostridium botulinum TaxID=1491 RepID=A0A126JI61_CLOBO|nr:hypothetical protein [Clostridium botulinum]ALT05376.1 hypothetical protein [Clostridium botulinum]NFH90564.1 hypothetical protein [Clostridium botulinum]NFI17248.1 hypothetical protein [Clostridium botulinum]NFN52973.1 hypothetical protein [Clostridium botulinum]NFO35045.1 hypothetical protein [Clostridium botulinum]